MHKKSPQGDFLYNKKVGNDESLPTQVGQTAYLVTPSVIVTVTAGSK